MKASKNAFLIINKYEKCNKQAISEIQETARQLNKILDAIEVHLNQNEFDSLVSLCFSLSTKEFLKTHLFDLLEANADRKEIAKEFKYLNEVRIGGTIQKDRSSKSLTERRKAEKELFLTPLYICDV
jgi:GH24 family phage-related lysozyme (muramidase)